MMLLFCYHPFKYIRTTSTNLSTSEVASCVFCATILAGTTVYTIDSCAFNIILPSLDPIPFLYSTDLVKFI
jgi:hypothetical protein